MIFPRTIFEWLRSLGTSAPAAMISLSDNELLARAVLEVAIEEIGQGEAEGNNRGPAIRRYLLGFLDARKRQRADGGAWCAAFASYCLREGARRRGIELPVVLHTGAKRLGRNVGAVGRLFTDPEEASPGDFAIWHRGAPDDWTGHIGIVERVDSDGRIHTIQGNKGAAGKAKVKRLIEDVANDVDFWTFASLRAEPVTHGGPLVA